MNMWFFAAGSGSGITQDKGVFKYKPTIHVFDVFSEQIFEEGHDLQSESIRVILSNKKPNVRLKDRADIEQISNSGYPTNGYPMVRIASYQKKGKYNLVMNDMSIRAVGSDVGPFRYLVVINNTISTNNLMLWMEIPEEMIIANGKTMNMFFKDPLIIGSYSDG